MSGTNVQLALSVALRLLTAVQRARQQDRDVTDEELDAAMSRADKAHDRIQEQAEQDGLADNPTSIHSGTEAEDGDDA